MNNIGKVIEYDGFNGIIESNGIKYIFNKNNVLNDIKIGDIVKFNSEIYKSVEIIKYVATFVEKIDKQ